MDQREADIREKWPDLKPHETKYLIDRIKELKKELKRVKLERDEWVRSHDFLAKNLQPMADE